ncbi:MAG: hypothetical protein JWO80_4862 [Bryobacterales bacterium]|nr:hypothetical protein [Bryobacterales bacterium]
MYLQPWRVPRLSRVSGSNRCFGPPADPILQFFPICNGFKRIFWLNSHLTVID